MVSEDEIRNAIIDAFNILGSSKLASIVAKSYISVYYEPPFLYNEYLLPGGLRGCIYYDDKFYDYMLSRYACNTISKVSDDTGVLLCRVGAREAYDFLAKKKDHNT
jgi:hypothetical protein